MKKIFGSNIAGWMMVILGIFQISLPAPASAQTNRYWANNYNEEAFLLSGAVVAGNTSAGAIYYNPAAISGIQNSRLSLNSNIISLNSLYLEQALGDNFDLKYSTINIQPSFISLLLKNKKLPNLTFEFGILTRENTKIDLNDGIHRRENLFPEILGEEIADIRIEYLMDYNDSWVGFGAGYKVNEKLSAGVSMFGILRSLSYKYLFDANAFPTTDSIVYEGEPLPFFNTNIFLRENLKYSQIRFLWKFGLLYATDRWSFGFNLSTPSVPIKLFSSSQAAKKISNTNVWQDGNFEPDIIVVDQQRKRPFNQKDPLSVSLGLRYNTEDRKHTYYATVEFFENLAPYPIFDAKINPDISTQEVFEQLPRKDFLSFYSAAKAVLNAAIGYRNRINERTSFLGGFRTDFNYLSNYDFSEPLVRPKNINVNVYHFTGGSMFHIRSSSFILGAQFSFGRQRDLPRIGTILDPDNPGLPRPPDAEAGTMTAKIRTLSLFIGFNISLGNRQEP